jgi:hypothetical protein
LDFIEHYSFSILGFHYFFFTLALHDWFFWLFFGIFIDFVLFVLKKRRGCLIEIFALFVFRIFVWPWKNILSKFCGSWSFTLSYYIVLQLTKCNRQRVHSLPVYWGHFWFANGLVA